MHGIFIGLLLVLLYLLTSWMVQSDCQEEIPDSGNELRLKSFQEEGPQINEDLTHLYNSVQGFSFCLYGF